jgi:hypothetical protein
VAWNTIRDGRRLIGRHGNILLQGAGRVAAGVVLLRARGLVLMANFTRPTRLVDPLDAYALANVTLVPNSAAKLDNSTNAFVSGDVDIHWVGSRDVIDVRVASCVFV